MPVAPISAREARGSNVVGQGRSHELLVSRKGRRKVQGRGGPVNKPRGLYDTGKRLARRREPARATRPSRGTAAQGQPRFRPALPRRPAAGCPALPSLSHVARRTSHVTRHTSHVTRHTSHVARQDRRPSV